MADPRSGKYDDTEFLTRSGRGFQAEAGTDYAEVTLLKTSWVSELWLGCSPFIQSKFRIRRKISIVLPRDFTYGSRARRCLRLTHGRRRATRADPPAGSGIQPRA